MDEKKKNFIQLNIAIFMFGLTSLFAKIIQLPVSHIIFGRSVIASLTLFAFINIKKIIVKPENKKDLFYLIILGAVLCVHWLSYFYSIQVSTVAIGIISLHTYPIITIIIEPFFFKEKHRAIDLFLGIVILIGIIVLIPDFDFTSKAAHGVIWGIFSAFLFAVRNIMSRKLVQKYAGSTLMFYQAFVTAVILLPLISMSSVSFSDESTVQILILGIFFTAIPQTLFTSSMSGLKAKTVSINATLLPVYGIIFAFIFLNEIPSMRTITGGAIVISTAIFEISRQMKKKL